MEQQDSNESYGKNFKETRDSYFNIKHDIDTTPGGYSCKNIHQFNISIDNSKDVVNRRQYQTGEDFVFLPKKLTTSSLSSHYTSLLNEQESSSKQRFKSHRVPNIKHKIQELSASKEFEESNASNQNNKVDCFKIEENKDNQEPNWNCTAEEYENQNSKIQLPFHENNNKMIVIEEKVAEPHRSKSNVNKYFIRERLLTSIQQKDNYNYPRQMETSVNIKRNAIRNIPHQIKKKNQAHSYDQTIQMNCFEFQNNVFNQREQLGSIKELNRNSFQFPIEEQKPTLDYFYTDQSPRKSIKFDTIKEYHRTGKHLSHSQKEDIKMTPFDDTDNTMSKESNNLTETSLNVEKRRPLEIVQRNINLRKPYHDTIQTLDSNMNTIQKEKYSTLDLKDNLYDEMITNHSKLHSLMIDAYSENQTPTNKDSNEIGKKPYKKTSTKDKNFQIRKNIISNEVNIYIAEDIDQKQSRNPNIKDHPEKERKMDTIKDVKPASETEKVIKKIQINDLNNYRYSDKEFETNMNFTKAVMTHFNRNNNLIINNKKSSLDPNVLTQKNNAKFIFQSEPDRKYDLKPHYDNTIKNQHTTGDYIYNTQPFNIQNIEEEVSDQKKNCQPPIKTYCHGQYNINPINEFTTLDFQDNSNNIHKLKESFSSQKPYENRKFQLDTQNIINYSSSFQSNINNIFLRTTEDDCQLYTNSSISKPLFANNQKEKGKNQSNNKFFKENHYETEATNTNFTYPQFITNTDQEEFSSYYDISKKTSKKKETIQSENPNSNNKQNQPLDISSEQSLNDLTNRYKAIREMNRRNNSEEIYQTTTDNNNKCQDKEPQKVKEPCNNEIVSFTSSIQSESYQTYNQQFIKSPFVQEDMPCENNKIEYNVNKEYNNNNSDVLQFKTKSETKKNELKKSETTYDNYTNYVKSVPKEESKITKETKTKKEEKTIPEDKKKSNQYYLYYTFGSKKIKDLSYNRFKEKIDQQKKNKNSLFGSNILKQNSNKKIKYTSPTDYYYKTEYIAPPEIKNPTVIHSIQGNLSNWNTNKKNLNIELCQVKTHDVSDYNKYLIEQKTQSTNTKTRNYISKQTNLARISSFSTNQSPNKFKCSECNCGTINPKYAKLFVNLDNFKKKKLHLI